jgi:hypothetical protein
MAGCDPKTTGRIGMEIKPAPAGGFVIALCAMTTAIPIPQPRSSPLNRFRFFLTRRNANGREFFVLYMGHFTTATEADKWLERLHGTYPNAYVSASSEASEGLDSAELSDTQTLRVLEARPPSPTLETIEVLPPPAPRVVKTPIGEKLKESLQDMAVRESETGNYEAISDTGVRHLRIEVQKPSRWFARSRSKR